MRDDIGHDPSEPQNDINVENANQIKNRIIPWYFANSNCFVEEIFSNKIMMLINYYVKHLYLYSFTTYVWHICTYVFVNIVSILYS